MVAQCLTTGTGQRYDAETETLLPHVMATLDATDGRKWGSDQWVNQGKAVVQPTYAIQGSMIGRNDSAGPQGDGINEEVCFTQNTTDRHAVAQPIGWSEELNALEGVQPTLQRGGQGGRHEGVMQPNMAVRRLTPTECERLQGFPDNYTNIKDKCPDGPRYKALGNSWAVPVVRWIGERIARAA